VKVREKMDSFQKGVAGQNPVFAQAGAQKGGVVADSGQEQAARARRQSTACPFDQLNFPVQPALRYSCFEDAVKIDFLTTNPKRQFCAKKETVWVPLCKMED
jgi:hypothetical protein